MKLHVALAADEFDIQARLQRLAERRCPDDPEGEMRRLEAAADETIEMMRNGLYTAESDPAPGEVATAATLVKSYKTQNVKMTMESLEKVIKRLRMNVVTLSGDKNPQIVAEYNRAKDRLELVEAIVQSMNGNHADLRIYE